MDPKRLVRGDALSAADTDSTIARLPHLHRASPFQNECPLVSICIPAFNREQYIDAAVESALSQTYRPLEIVVVDDASTDATVARVRSYNDPRIRLFVNDRNLGQSANRNRAIALARGELIKFLDSDDMLDPECVARIVPQFVEDPTVGLVFARQRVTFEVPVDRIPPHLKGTWLGLTREAHRGFSELRKLNDGRMLLAEMLSGDGPIVNWIGQPSAVMVRRAHLEVSGGFAYNVRMRVELDLWMRLLAHARVGFIDDKLVTYRWGHEAENASISRLRSDWIEQLWILEALACDRETRRAYPQIDARLRKERRQTYRTALRLGYPAYEGAERRPVGAYLRYVRFRILSKAGRPPALFAVLPRATEPTR
jgi:glycosyltransferase involved in cell wall biosynthesis